MGFCELSVERKLFERERERERVKVLRSMKKHNVKHSNLLPSLIRLFCVCFYVFVCMNTVFIYIDTKCNMWTKVFPVFGVPLNI